MPAAIAFQNIDADMDANQAWFAVGPQLTRLMKSVAPARERGYLLKSEFVAICKEKSSRRVASLEKNSEEAIEKISRLAYQMEDDPFIQISLLRSFKGVAVPRASCLLAWVFPEKYPVIDWRAWKVLHRYGLVNRNPEGRNLQPDHWVDYLKVVQDLANRRKKTPMLIDRWLWHAEDHL